MIMNFLENEYHVYVDGSCKPNPGEMSCAWLLYHPKSKSIYKSEIRRLGQGTNQIAEFQAVMSALKAIKPHKDRKIKLYSDSKFVLNCIMGAFKTNRVNFTNYIKEIKELLKDFKSIRLLWDNKSILNSMVDELVKAEYKDGFRPVASLRHKLLSYIDRLGNVKLSDSLIKSIIEETTETDSLAEEENTEPDRKSVTSGRYLYHGDRGSIPKLGTVLHREKEISREIQNEENSRYLLSLFLTS